MPAIQKNTKGNTKATEAEVKPVTNAAIVDAAAERARMQIANPFTAKAMDFAKAFDNDDVNAFITEDLDREDKRTRSTLEFMGQLMAANEKVFNSLPRHDAAIGSNNPRFFKYEREGRDGVMTTRDDGDIYTEMSRDHTIAAPILEELAAIDADKTMDATTKTNRKATLNARLKRIKTLIVEAVTIRDIMEDIKALPNVDAYIQLDDDGAVLPVKTPMVVCSTKDTERTKVMPMPVSRFIGLEPEKAKGSASPYDVLVGATQRDRAKAKNQFLPKNLNQFELAMFAMDTYLAPLTMAPPNMQLQTSLINRLKSKGGAGFLLAANRVHDHLIALLTDETVSAAYSKASQEEEELNAQLASKRKADDAAIVKGKAA